MLSEMIINFCQSTYFKISAKFRVFLSYYALILLMVFYVFIYLVGRGGVKNKVDRKDIGSKKRRIKEQLIFQENGLQKVKIKTNV